MFYDMFSAIHLQHLCINNYDIKVRHSPFLHLNDWHNLEVKIVKRNSVVTLLCVFISDIMLKKKFPLILFSHEGVGKICLELKGIMEELNMKSKRIFMGHHCIKGKFFVIPCYFLNLRT